jgi:ribosomal protein S18 acetylase RimI-like enzyme
MIETIQMDDLLIRPAGTPDIPAVLALWNEARSAAAMTPDTDDAVTRLLEHDGSLLLVAEHDHHIVGSLIVGWDGWRGNMYRLAVAPYLRRQGIARRLVEAAHEHLVARGARRVTALVAHDEDEATGLWRSAGYEYDENISRFVRNL